jgi:hypothetical protein
VESISCDGDNGEAMNWEPTCNSSNQADYTLKFQDHWYPDLMIRRHYLRKAPPYGG